MKIIGLTGGIASGKSTISNRLLEKGYTVIDADIAARKVVEIGTPALQEIRDFFGKDVLQEDGTLNRKKLGEIVFADEFMRKKLNELTHPRIREWMLNQVEQAAKNGAELVFMDIPLLYESEALHLTEKVIVVYLDEETQIQRLMERDKLTKDQALQRIRSQLSMEEKKARADYIIDNRGTKKEALCQLDKILLQIKGE
ncbi:MAG: dephospho-CoA kinase [Bacillales bacterium]|jgi:dephospho-CoA kinase|nr:dephospho-CoA kinase [Bacillales bacterium]